MASLWGFGYENLWYTADWDMWLKLAACGPIHYPNGLTVGFRIHDGSLTVTGNSHDTTAFTRQMQIVLDRHLCRSVAVRRPIERAARVSITVSTALSAASAGNRTGLWRAAHGGRAARALWHRTVFARFADRGAGGTSRSCEIDGRVLKTKLGVVLG